MSHSKDLKKLKATLQEEAERVAETFYIDLNARTKAELASFLSYHDPREILRKPNARKPHGNCDCVFCIELKEVRAERKAKWEAEHKMKWEDRKAIKR